jgi:hypothetical protein
MVAEEANQCASVGIGVVLFVVVRLLYCSLSVGLRHGIRVGPKNTKRQLIVNFKAASKHIRN